MRSWLWWGELFVVRRSGAGAVAGGCVGLIGASCGSFGEKPPLGWTCAKSTWGSSPGRWPCRNDGEEGRGIGKSA